MSYLIPPSFQLVQSCGEGLSLGGSDCFLRSLGGVSSVSHEFRVNLSEGVGGAVRERSRRTGRRRGEGRNEKIDVSLLVNWMGATTYTLERRVSVGLGLVESVSVRLVRLVVRGVILGFSHLLETAIRVESARAAVASTHLNERTWIEERRRAESIFD